MYRSKTSASPTAEWKNIPWYKLERVVFKLQKRIYNASQRGDFKAVRKLQKTLIKSWSARCLSVRLLTQKDGESRKSEAGDDFSVDQILVKLAIAPTEKTKFELNSLTSRSGNNSEALHDHSLMCSRNDDPTAEEGKEKREKENFFSIFNFLLHKTYPQEKGGKTTISPSKFQRKEHYQQLASIINAHKSAAQEVLIRRLNPVIKEWVNYYSSQVSNKSLAHLDHLVFLKLIAWAKGRHPQKSRTWVLNKYWSSINGENRVFATKCKENNLILLLAHTSFTAVGLPVKHQIIEEPDEVKVSRPVLKTSRSGD
ncbi:reverse transcriptase N-terminal domain-containing protein [Lyngbya aestuarii]|uniref:reverse transcriptase N-terminal domain-containing protein n=1 Tax=Lyngbya aestuarii TaxID=118322 RepID=UPI00403DB3E8